MNWNDRSSWVYEAKDAISEFGARNIDLPKRVTDAIAAMNRVAASKPTKPSPTEIREAIIAGAAQDELDRLLLADAVATKLASEWAQAHIDTAGGVLSAIRRSVDELLPALRERAEAAIAKLTAVADLGEFRIDQLIRAGRVDDAKLAADAALTGAELDNLYGLRNRFLTRSGGRELIVNGVSCATWRDPDAAAAHARGATPTDQLIAGLKAGVPLYFPSPDEAIAAAQEVADARAADAARVRAREHGIGSFATFG